MCRVCLSVHVLMIGTRTSRMYARMHLSIHQCQKLTWTSGRSQRWLRRKAPAPPALVMGLLPTCIYIYFLDFMADFDGGWVDDRGPPETGSAASIRTRLCIYKYRERERQTTHQPATRPVPNRTQRRRRPRPPRAWAWAGCGRAAPPARTLAPPARGRPPVVFIVF